MASGHICLVSVTIAVTARLPTLCSAHGTSPTAKASVMILIQTTILHPYNIESNATVTIIAFIIQKI